MTVLAKVVALRSLSDPGWSFAADVTLGENVNGIVGLSANVHPGRHIQCRVIQVDHQTRRVALIESEPEPTAPPA
jgi:hypothetical protein